MSTKTITIDLDTPCGPVVTYTLADSIEAVDAAIPAGYQADYTNQIKLASGEFRSPLVRSEAVLSNGVEVMRTWYQDFDAVGGIKAAIAEAEAYVDGINDAAPGEFETTVEEYGEWVRVIVSKKTPTP